VVSMGFYESISAWYDLIFPVDPQAVRFLAERARPGSRILDLACGTGGHSLALAERGFQVSGVDLDASMIREAERKAGGAAGVKFRIMDMLDIGRRLEPGFSLVFCIGNSLVHLKDEGRIGRMLAAARGLLEPGGALVVQIIHYDRILAAGISALPILRDEAHGLEFVRNYDYDAAGRVVQFRTVLSVRQGGTVRRIENNVPLWILRKDVLERLAREAGFGDLTWYGGFDGRPLGPDSLPLILEGRRE
jgi:glycine/sarcosine N-methyltransferase